MEARLFKVMSLADQETLNELTLIVPNGEKVYNEVMIEKAKSLQNDKASMSNLYVKDENKPLIEFLISHGIFDIIPIGDINLLLLSIINNGSFELYPILSSFEGISWFALIEPTIKSGNFIVLKDILSREDRLSSMFSSQVSTKKENNERSRTLILTFIVMDKHFDKLYNHVSITSSQSFLDKCMKYALQYKSTSTLTILFNNIDIYPISKEKKDDLIDEIFDGSVRNDDDKFLKYIITKISSDTVQKKDIMIRALDFGANKVLSYITDNNVSSIVNMTTFMIAIKSGTLNKHTISFINKNIDKFNEEQLYTILDTSVSNLNVGVIDMLIDIGKVNSINVLRKLMKMKCSVLPDNRIVLYNIVLQHLFKLRYTDLEAHIDKIKLTAIETDNLPLLICLSSNNVMLNYVDIACKCSSDMDILNWAYIKASLDGKWDFDELETEGIPSVSLFQWINKKRSVHQKIDELYDKN
jgi:hypothetical protein